MLLFVIAAWLGGIAYAVSIPGGTGPLPLLPTAAAIIVAGAGARRIGRLSVLPGSVTFDGQVIACWVEEDNSENGSGRVPHVALDDGQRGWTFTGSATADRVALGDLVQVTVNPRSGNLLSLTVTSRPRTGHPDGPPLPGELPAAPPQPLLTAAELAGLLGPGVRSTALPSPAGRGMIHQGDAGALTLIVVSGRIADINLRHARKHGLPLPGAGDEAWLINRGRAMLVLVRAGPQIAKLTVTGQASGRDPDLLRALAATVAARLAALSSGHP